MFAVTTDFPLASAAHQQPAGRLDAAHQLADDVDRRVVDDRAGVVREPVRGERQPSVTAGVTYRHPDDLEVHAGTPRDVVAVLVEEPDHGGAHGPAAEQPDANGAPVPRVRFPRAHPSPPIQAAMSISSS